MRLGTKDSDHVSYAIGAYISPTLPPSHPNFPIQSSSAPSTMRIAPPPPGQRRRVRPSKTVQTDPKQCGLWYEDTHGLRFLAPLHTGREKNIILDGPRTIVLPNLHAVKYVNRERQLLNHREHRDEVEAFQAENERRLRLWKDPLGAMSEWNASAQREYQEQQQRQMEGKKQTTIFDLPPELLLHIFELLVSSGAQDFEPLLPTGRIFHLFHTQRSVRGQNRDNVCIHQLFFPKQRIRGARTTLAERNPVIRGLVDLSLVCQTFKDLAYLVFYGNNHFVVELAAGTCNATIQILDKAESEICSWSKVRHSENSVGGGMGLSTEAWKYIDHLLLTIHLSCEKPRRREWEKLEEQVEELKDHFVGKRISITAGVLKRQKGKAVGALLEIRESENARGERAIAMQMRNDGAFEGNSEVQTRLRQLIAPLVTDDEQRQVDLGGLLRGRPFREPGSLEDADTGRCTGEQPRQRLKLSMEV